MWVYLDFNEQNKIKCTNELVTFQDQPIIEPVVLIDEPQEMDQQIVQANDSVYEYDTQLIQPVIHDNLINNQNEVQAKVRIFF